MAQRTPDRPDVGDVALHQRAEPHGFTVPGDEIVVGKARIIVGPVTATGPAGGLSGPAKAAAGARVENRQTTSAER